LGIGFRLPTVKFFPRVRQIGAKNSNVELSDSLRLIGKIQNSNSCVNSSSRRHLKVVQTGCCRSCKRWRWRLRRWWMWRTTAGITSSPHRRDRLSAECCGSSRGFSTARESLLCPPAGFEPGARSERELQKILHCTGEGC
jgi:hypothetical protein